MMNTLTELNVVKYNSTIGMLADVPGYYRPQLVSIAYDRLSDGTFRCYVESGEDLSTLESCGVKILTEEEIDDILDDIDVYDDVAKFRALAKIFDIYK